MSADQPGARGLPESTIANFERQSSLPPGTPGQPGTPKGTFIHGPQPSPGSSLPELIPPLAADRGGAFLTHNPFDDPLTTAAAIRQGVPPVSGPPNSNIGVPQINPLYGSPPFSPGPPVFNNQFPMQVRPVGHPGPPGAIGHPGHIDNGKTYPPNQPMVFNPSNPNAPPIYPCGICHKEVHENDEAILCESGCNFWFHRLCTGLSDPAYHLLRQEVYAEWVCDRCLTMKNIPLVKLKP